MKLQNKFQYIATPAKVFMVVFIILIAVSILQGICIEIEQAYARKKRFTSEEKPEAELTQEEKRQDRIIRSAKEFLPDGTIHLIDRAEHISGRRYQSDIVQIYDTNDNLLWEGPSTKKPYEYLSWAEQLRSYREVFSRQEMKRTQMITSSFSRYIEMPVGLDGKIEQIWRYQPDSQYFKGYDTSGEETRYLGSTGYTSSKSKVKPLGKFMQFIAWCPLDTSNLLLLWQTQKRIYQINFEKQEVELIFESPDADIERVSLHAWMSLSPDSKDYINHQNYRPLMHCETRDGKHHLILRGPKEQFVFNLRRPSFVATRQAIFVLNRDNDTPPFPDINSPQEVVDKWVQELRGKSWNFWNELYKVNNQGNLELLNRYDWIRLAVSGFETKARDPRPIVHRSVSQFSPVLYDLITYFGGRFRSRSYLYQNRGTLSHDLLVGIHELRPYSGLINWILSPFMIILVFWHGWPRRTSRAKFVFWLIFAGLINIAGLLTYLALNHTAIIKCPACGKRRGLGQAECVRCRVQLPAPELGKLDLIFDI